MAAMTYANTVESSNHLPANTGGNGEAALTQKVIFYGQLAAAICVVFIIAVTLTMQGMWYGAGHLFGKGAASGRLPASGFRPVC
jgi:hypothetical protein